jgi:hypothetical protein
MFLSTLHTRRYNLTAWRGGEQLVNTVAAANPCTIVVVHASGVGLSSLSLSVLDQHSVLPSLTLLPHSRAAHDDGRLDPAPERHGSHLRWTSRDGGWKRYRRCAVRGRKPVSERKLRPL